MEGTIGRKLPQKGAAGAADPLGPAKENTNPKGPGESTREASITQGIDTIAGRYKLKEILGRGGVGVVYRASDMDLGEEIAIKVLQGQATRNAADLERFKREIITARKITHANVIRIHDFGMSGDEAFISMELLGGGTLADRIEDGPMEIKPGLEIAIGICEGLEAAHQVGIIHRDIKPDNVIFDDAGRPKLVDFGLARLASAPTRTIGFSGTPFYVSPEQAEGGEVTGRSDIYSLGVLLFEMFTGRLPFLADNLVRLAMMHANEQPPTPRSVRPDLPVVLDAAILRCLQKDALVRYATAAEVAVDLRAIRDGKNPPGLARAREQATMIRSMPSTETTRPAGDNTVPEAPSAERTQAPSPVNRTPTGERVSGRMRQPSPTPVPARPVSRSVPEPAFDESGTERPPVRKSGAALQFALGGGGVLLLGLIAIFAVGGFGPGGDPVPSATPVALMSPSITSTPVATETLGMSTPDEPRATATPRNPRPSPTPSRPTPTPTPTKVAVASPIPKTTPVATVDLTQGQSANVRFIGFKLLGGANKFPFVRSKALGLRCDKTPKNVPVTASAFPATFYVELFDSAECKSPSIAAGNIEVRSGGTTFVTVDPPRGISSKFTPEK